MWEYNFLTTNYNNNYTYIFMKLRKIIRNTNYI